MTDSLFDFNPTSSRKAREMAVYDTLDPKVRAALRKAEWTADMCIMSELALMPVQEAIQAIEEQERDFKAWWWSQL